MNKAELIKAVEDRLETGAKSAKEAVDHVVDIIIREVAKGEKVAISGFGVFEKRRRGPRTARNPKTGAAVKVKARSVPSFRAGTPFKEVVSGTKKLDKVVKSTARSAAGAATKAAPAKKTAAKSMAAKSAPAKSTSAKKTAAAKTLAKKTPPKKAATKTQAAKTLAKKTPAKKAAAKKATAKKAAKKSAAAKKSS